MIEIPFIDRVKEVRALKEFSMYFRGQPLYIYGPEGCGKTRLLREFVCSFNSFFGEKAIAIYIDALERKSIEKAIYVSRPIEIVKKILREYVEKLNVFGVGRVLIELIGDILEKAITRKRLEDSYVLIAIDDVVKAIGIEEIERYIKWLYELLWKLYSEYKPKAINFIVTTSEGQSLEIVSKHRHAGIALLWNLDRDSFEKLFKVLNPPQHIEFNSIWRFLGGNPGKLIELALYYRWSLDKWFRDLVDRLRPIVIEIKSRNLIEELKLLIEDPDNVIDRASTKMNELRRFLIESNLFMYKAYSTIDSSYIHRDSELGIGEYYAWQIPAYRIALENLIT